MLFSMWKAGVFLLSLPHILTQVHAQTNAFTNPSPGPNQHYPQGSFLVTEFETNYKHPYLSLYCSDIVNRKLDPSVLEAVFLTTVSSDMTLAIIKEAIFPAWRRQYVITLNYAPQPNCYLHMQDGNGTAASAPSFGTGIFAITADANWAGNVVDIPNFCAKR